MYKCYLPFFFYSLSSQKLILASWLDFESPFHVQNRRLIRVYYIVHTMSWYAVAVVVAELVVGLRD